MLFDERSEEFKDSSEVKLNFSEAGVAVAFLFTFSAIGKSKNLSGLRMKKV
ncbi:hypothetical protein [Paludibacter sp. 221]|uniref:hypothetical protein n=1 Tax=Paludibacter sp. 221 TaxID=2302939 RepID=UPI0013D24360|nr:hypothetical protein [Paludibacter sp. 221]